MNPETIDRIIDEAHRELGLDHDELLNDLSAYLKDPATDRIQGASLSYRFGLVVGGIFLRSGSLDNHMSCEKVMALMNLKLDIHDYDQATLRGLAYPSVWDRLMKDDD